jgi:uridine kinase
MENLRRIMNPVIIGIAGGTGSGKTCVTKAIQESISDHITVIPQDAYYKNFTDLNYEQRNAINYDHPNAIDTELLINHIRALKDSVPVKQPIYDFKSHSRAEETCKVYPNTIIVIEGILIFENEEIRKLLDIKIYVDTDSDIRILRRIERDMAERGRTLESIMHRYRTMVRPMHIRFVEPTKRYADIIVPEGGHNKIAIDMIISRLKHILVERKKISYE